MVAARIANMRQAERTDLQLSGKGRKESQPEAAMVGARIANLPNGVRPTSANLPGSSATQPEAASGDYALIIDRVIAEVEAPK